jgi:hypothetical protein
MYNNYHREYTTTIAELDFVREDWVGGTHETIPPGAVYANNESVWINTYSLYGPGGLLRSSTRSGGQRNYPDDSTISTSSVGEALNVYTSIGTSSDWLIFYERVFVDTVTLHGVTTNYDDWTQAIININGQEFVVEETVPGAGHFLDVTVGDTKYYEDVFGTRYFLLSYVVDSTDDDIEIVFHVFSVSSAGTNHMVERYVWMAESTDDLGGYCNGMADYCVVYYNGGVDPATNYPGSYDYTSGCGHYGVYFDEDAKKCRGVLYGGTDFNFRLVYGDNITVQFDE